GVQGATVTASHTLLTDGTSAARVYVGMTRGREQNQLHIVAESAADARAQFIEAMERDRADRGLTDATQRATEAVAGLIEDGPVKRVNTAIARLTQRAEQAEQRAARFAEFAEQFDRLSEQHQHERAHAEHIAQATAQTAAQLRENIRDGLRPTAESDATDVLRVADAHKRGERQARAAGPFTRRRARKARDTARQRLDAAHARLAQDWGAAGTLHTGNVE